MEASDQFDDVDGNTHEFNINCAAQYDLVQGLPGGDSYGPNRSLSRGQMATIIVNFVETASGETLAAGADRFNDDDTSVHEDNINKGAAAGLFSGVTATEFRPLRDVTRDQMATFTAQAIEYVAGDEALPDSSNDHFEDVAANNTHRQNIYNIEAQDIVSGITETTYRPGQAVSRAQIASFVMQGADYLNSLNEWEPTRNENPTVTATVADDEVDAGDDVTVTFSGNTGLIDTIDASGDCINDANDLDRDGNSVTVTTTETARGDCDITFVVTYTDDSTQTITVDVNVIGAPSATARPELTNASIVSTTVPGQQTTTNPLGTVVEYSFSESIESGATDATVFYVYDADGTVADAGDEVVSRSANTVRIRFTDLDTVAEVEDLTLATVDIDAVTDVDGLTNPEGSAAIGTAAAPDTVGSAGTTAAPDLLSVSNFRQSATPALTAVNFTFDEAAYVVTPTGFSLVAINGEEITCAGPAVGSTNASGGTVPGGNGTSVITVTCDNFADGTTAPSSTNIARGTVDTNTVRDGAATPNASTDNTNVLQAVDVANSGNTVDPDLVSAEFRPSTTGGADQVLFVFDENIDTASSTSFQIYTIDAVEQTGSSTTNAVVNTSNRRQVLVTFAAGALDEAVGASVLDSAVIALDNGVGNQQDEVGVANPQLVGGRTPGVVDAPQLTSVTHTAGTDPFGNPDGSYEVTYTFDEDVTAAVVAGNFYLYLADGTRLTVGGCNAGITTTPTNTTDDNTVTCTTSSGTSAQVAAATLGTVDDGAVVGDDSGNFNPEGAAFVS